MWCLPATASVHRRLPQPGQQLPDAHQVADQRAQAEFRRTLKAAHRERVVAPLARRAEDVSDDHLACATISDHAGSNAPGAGVCGDKAVRVRSPPGPPRSKTLRNSFHTVCSFGGYRAEASGHLLPLASSPRRAKSGA